MTKKQLLPEGIKDITRGEDHIVVELVGKVIKQTVLLAIMRLIEVKNLRLAVFNYAGKKILKLEKDY